jgi:hypothetical protein
VNAAVYAQGTNKVTKDFQQDSLGGRLLLDWGDVTTDPAGYDGIEADRAARLQFLAKYRQARTAFQGGTFLGELANTVKMIRHPAQVLREAIDVYHRALKKKLIRRGLDRKFIQESWLEAQYGWLPFINDIRSAAKIGTASPYKVREELHSFAQVDIESNVLRQSANNGLAIFDGTIQNVGFVTCVYKGAVNAVNSPPGFPEQLGFSWSNVLPTAWELIPYSFLVDYFSNIGKVIDGMSVGSVSLAWGCKTTVKKFQVKLVSSRFNRELSIAGFGSAYKDITGYATGGGFLSSRTSASRRIVTGVTVGIGDVQFKLPGSSTQWLNIGALLAGGRRDRSFLADL